VLESRVRRGFVVALIVLSNHVECYAFPIDVLILISGAGDQLQIIISDNGKGFNTGEKHGGNGLKNLPLRISKLGGRYRIESAIGKGTMVTIGLRLALRAGTLPAGGQS